MSNRYFRTSDEIFYEQIRLLLDNSWGIEPPQTCIEPSLTAPRDSNGYILLGVNKEFCNYPIIIDLLPQILQSGIVQEIDENTFRSSLLLINNV
jgi:hypothetical protein